jgi:hypothetical protein
MKNFPEPPHAEQRAKNLYITYLLSTKLFVGISSNLRYSINGEFETEIQFNIIKFMIKCYITPFARKYSEFPREPEIRRFRGRRR